MTIEFRVWPKIPRFENKKEIYTEKIDGTNACIIITEDGEFGCQSRKQIITPENDNFFFANWAYQNKEELLKLGPGHHFGEWWGVGIQRGYGLTERRFSLFNVHRWGPHNPNTPACVHIVPQIQANSVQEARDMLITGGSLAAPGYMNVEGVVVYEEVGKAYYKSTIKKNTE